MFVEIHLKKFRDLHKEPPIIAETDQGEGRSPRQWFKSVAHSFQNVNYELLAETPVNRAYLKELQADTKTPTLELCISILAWGGMRISNGKQLFSQNNDHWLCIAEELRRGDRNRKCGYNEFAAHRKQKQLQGLGPAYFTKLLYILPPEKNKGYIMDQWLGLSINILTGKEIVKLNESITWEWKQKPTNPRLDSWVCDYNTADDYENFCTKIESLSSKMGNGWGPELTELALISEGGRANKKKLWRNYVENQRIKRLLKQ